MDNFTQELVNQLNVETVFTINLPFFGQVGIAESVVVTWIVMAILVVFAIWITHDLKVHDPSKKQAAAELIVTGLDSFTQNMLGKNATEYSGYIATVLLYIGVANLIGLFGFKPPTKDMNVTIALALMSIILVEASGIRAHGFKGWLKDFTKPLPIITPLNVLEIGIRPLSLCMRLFGNVLGSFIIMEMIKIVVPMVVPAFLSLYFDIFDGLIQAYVFVFLTSLYISEATE